MRVKIKMNAPVTISFLVVACLAFVVNVVTLGASNQLLFSVYRSPLSSVLTWLRLVLHMFGHASLEHLFGNATLLLLVGPIVEERLGSLAYLRACLLTSVVIGLAQFILFPTHGLLGLSGVVFMLIVLSAYGDVKESHTIPITVVLVILLWIGKELFDSVLKSDNVSQFSHLLGGWCGFVFGYIRRRK